MIKHHRGYGENLGDYRLLIALEESPASLRQPPMRANMRGEWASQA
ncbi:MAG TPA: hypothetical protein VE242_04255 [Chthoniobacterales bacterium]|nr:hypothetical protein [Chthoniobacterales bacterium]